MSDRTYNLLFLCTGNSARSILAESIVNHLGAGRIKGYSAGSQPHGEVHPYALDLLQGLGLSTHGLRSKSWTSSRLPARPKWISSLRFATTPRAKLARHGRGSR